MAYSPNSFCPEETIAEIGFQWDLLQQYVSRKTPNFECQEMYEDGSRVVILGMPTARVCPNNGGS